MRMVTIWGSKELVGAEGLAVRLQASAGMMARNAERVSARAARINTLPPHRRSVERAALAIEARFVKGLWVLQLAVRADSPRESARNGLSYMQDSVDRYGQAVANGGWDMPAPRPAAPSGKEIDAAMDSQRWLSFLEPLEARVLTVGALSKRGDAGRRVNWMRVRDRLPELGGYSTRSLQAIYTRALRNIVAELTAEKIMVFG